VIRSIRTHTMGMGGRCADCHALLPDLKDGSQAWPATRLGVIVADFGGTHAYKTGQNDTNPPCTPPALAPAAGVDVGHGSEVRG
jgi:hypothetical protein